MKLSKLTFIMLAAGMGVISSNAQDRNRPSSREDARKAWAERVKKYQEARAKAAQGSSSQDRSNSRSSQNRQPSSREQSGSRGQANRLDPEAVKRRLDYGVKEGLLTREQAGCTKFARLKPSPGPQRDPDSRGDYNRAQASNAIRIAGETNTEPRPCDPDSRGD